MKRMGVGSETRCGSGGRVGPTKPLPLSFKLSAWGIGLDFWEDYTAAYRVPENPSTSSNINILYDLLQ